MPDTESDPDHLTDPSDPFEPTDAIHVDELPPFNGDRKASFAFDGAGTRYKVTSGDRFPSTNLIPERQWRETVLPERDGVGEPCAACGDQIEWDAIIVNAAYHLRCYLHTDAGDAGGGGRAD